MPRYAQLPIAIAVAVAAQSVPVNALHAQDRSMTRERSTQLNCALQLTNDAVKDAYMMQDVADNAQHCRSLCSQFAESSLLSMRDAVRVLRYTCSYQGRIIDRRNLK